MRTNAQINSDVAYLLARNKLTNIGYRGLKPPVIGVAYLWHASLCETLGDVAYLWRASICRTLGDVAYLWHASICRTLGDVTYLWHILPCEMLGDHCKTLGNYCKTLGNYCEMLGNYCEPLGDERKDVPTGTAIRVTGGFNRRKQGAFYGLRADRYATTNDFV